MAHDHKGDARAAFMGLIIGAIALLAILSTIVHFTNVKYAGHQAEAPAAQTH